ncbi:MAG: glycosyltransferase family 25 protein [Flavisolibacter sp.]
MSFFDFINKTFDRIYVITLQRAQDRRTHFEKELNGLNYTVFYGQDKEEFNVEELKDKNIYNEELARKHHRYNKVMPAGMIGCSWSHRLVYEDMVKNNYEKVLILEDDIVIDRTTISILPEAFKELPSDWELVYFGYALNETVPPNAFLKKTFYHLLRLFGLIRYTHKTIEHLYPKKVSRHIFKSGYHDCTHAYAIKLSAAKKLIDLQTPISFFPDNLLAHAATNNIIRSYIIIPRIINQQYQVGQPSFSYINE